MKRGRHEWIPQPSKAAVRAYQARQFLGYAALLPAFMALSILAFLAVALVAFLVGSALG